MAHKLAITAGAGRGGAKTDGRLGGRGRGRRGQEPGGGTRGGPSQEEEPWLLLAPPGSSWLLLGIGVRRKKVKDQKIKDPKKSKIQEEPGGQQEKK